MIITFFNLIFILYIIYCQNARGILHLFTVFGNTYRFSSFYQNKYTKYFTPVKTPHTYPFTHEVFIFKYANATQNPQFSHHSTPCTRHAVTFISIKVKNTGSKIHCLTYVNHPTHFPYPISFKGGGCLFELPWVKCHTLLVTSIQISAAHIAFKVTTLSVFYS